MKRTEINEKQRKFIKQQFNELAIFTTDLLEDYGAWEGKDPTDGYSDFLRFFFASEDAFFKELDRLTE